MHITLVIIFTVLLLPGFVAQIMMLPGVPYMFVIALVFGFLDHFTHLTGTNIAILAGIAACTLIVDQLAGFIAAKWGGAQGKTFLFAMAGALVGSFIFPLFGGLIGLFVGILIGEMIRRRGVAKKTALVQPAETPLTQDDLAHLKGSLKAASAGVIGSLTGIVIDLCLAVLFVTLFVIFALT